LGISAIDHKPHRTDPSQKENHSEDANGYCPLIRFCICLERNDDGGIVVDIRRRCKTAARESICGPRREDLLLLHRR
jgi:hypothetical protein